MSDHQGWRCAGDPSATTTASLSTPDTSAGELITDQQRQRGRARRTVRVARTRLLRAWHQPGTVRLAGRELASQVLTALVRYPRAGR